MNPDVVGKGPVYAARTETPPMGRGLLISAGPRFDEEFSATITTVSPQLATPFSPAYNAANTADSGVIPVRGFLLWLLNGCKSASDNSLTRQT